MNPEVGFVRRIAEHHTPTRDTVVIVHSAFRQFAKHGAEPERFCNELMKWVGPGTLLMPAMSWRNVAPEQPVFDELKTPGHTGIVSETFRKLFSTHRSLHPTHSVSGVGPLASGLLSSHHQGATPCADNSPYGLVRERDFWIVLMGVGLECCTAIHHCEESIAPDRYLLPSEYAEDYTLVNRFGKSCRMELRRHVKKARDFNKFTRLMTEGHDYWCGESYETPWMLVCGEALYRVVFETLKTDPNGTFLQNEM